MSARKALLPLERMVPLRAVVEQKRKKFVGNDKTRKKHAIPPCRCRKKKKVLLVGECFWENSEFGRKHGKKRQTRKLAKGEKSYLLVAEKGFGGQLRIFLWLGRLGCCLEKRLDVRDILLGLLFLSNEQRNAPISFAGGCQRKKGKEEEKVFCRRIIEPHKRNKSCLLVLPIANP